MVKPDILILGLQGQFQAFETGGSRVVGVAGEGGCPLLGGTGTDMPTRLLTWLGCAGSDSAAYTMKFERVSFDFHGIYFGGSLASVSFPESETFFKENFLAMDVSELLTVQI